MERSRTIDVKDCIKLMRSFSLSSTVRSHPRFDYEKIKDDILGRNYTLSLVFIGNIRAKKLNYKYRGKSYIPNVLSFPLNNDRGEIYITPKTAKAEAKKHGLTGLSYIVYLYVHALLHLKGLKHGKKMEKLEKKFCQKYNII